MKILIVFGTRPEAIKMAPVVKALAAQPQIQSRICITGQHRHMLDQVMNWFDIEADIDLNLMQERQTLADLSARILSGVDQVLADWRPDLVLVHGDTTTSFTTALAAFYRKIKVGHIEAGLRTGLIDSPWPEEANRKMTTTIAALHFAPTAKNRSNLLAEGVEDARISVTGNTVIDSLKATIARIRGDEQIRSSLCASFPFLQTNDPIALVTGHRRENFGRAFEEMCLGLRDLSRSGVHIVYSVHLNPAVREPVNKILGGHTNVTLFEPLEYLPFTFLMDSSRIIITDSGGIQEEGPALGKPVLVTRNTTERPEAVVAGTVVLVGTDRTKIADKAREIIGDPALYAKMSCATNPYGDGNASAKIVERICDEYQL